MGGTVGGSIAGKINSEYDLKEAAKLIAERDELSNMLHKVINDFGTYSRPISDIGKQPNLTIVADSGNELRMTLPRWITKWIEGGLENRIDEIKKKLTAAYGLEQ